MKEPIRLRCLFIAVVVLGVNACTTWEVEPLALPADLHDVRTKSAEGVTVSVAILPDEAAEAHFGLDLGADDIQAIWVRVQNGTPHTLWFLRAVLDPDFYPADEVASITASSLDDENRDAALQRLRDQSMQLKLSPGERQEGFVFAPRALGGRYVDVRLVEDVYEAELKRQRAREEGDTAPPVEDLEFRFGFALRLPDGIFDYERLDPARTYPDQVLPELSLGELRRRIEALPCCSRNRDGDQDGDPLNVVIVGNSADVLNSLSRAGWSFTHRITPRSVTRLVGASLEGDAYPVAPVSPLYAFDRKQDFALQRARTSIAQRNHMRLWLAPFRHGNRHVWVGQISRDIGIKLTPKAATMTTHIIAPEVDQAREYLLQTLLAGGFVEAFGFAAGSRQATPDAPAMNLVDDPYFSDGMRLVVILSPDPVPYGQVRSLLWRQSAAPVEEGQSMAPKAETATPARGARNDD